MDTEGRRAAIDAKQAILGHILGDVSCEGALLLVPAHLAWFAGGLNIRGLLADSERPAIFTNGKTRWLICSNADTQRLFDEELDGLGFMVKEWNWLTGRAQLLGEMVQGKAIAADRPFPGLTLIVDRLRLESRKLYAPDVQRLQELGQAVAHAVEATARNMRQGSTEQEVAGELAHRAWHRGVEVHALSVSSGDRPARFPRHGATEQPISTTATLQLTGTQHGLYATASRTLSFGTVPSELSQAYTLAAKMAAVYRHATKAELTVNGGVDAVQPLLRNTAYEHEWRLCPPCHGTGWVPAEELLRAGHPESFADQQAVVWQARVGQATIVDTLLATGTSGQAITPPKDWPYKRLVLAGQTYDIPDILLRTPELLEEEPIN